MQALILGALMAFLSAAGPAGREGAQREALDALDGLDPVLLIGGKEVPGKSAFSVTRGNFVYLFATAETKATFERDPARYEIQLGGMCAKMGRTAGGNPADFIVHEGKIYIFGSDDCHKKFQANPAKYLITPPPPLPADASAAARGQRLIEQAVTAIGGAARLDAVTSYVESFSQVQNRPQGEATITTKTIWSFPDRVRQERTMALQGKTMASATIVAPEGMWFVGGAGQAYPMPPFGRPSLEQEFGRHPIALLRARRNPAFKAVALGTAPGRRRKGRRGPRSSAALSTSRSPWTPARTAESARRPSWIETTRVSSALLRLRTRTSGRLKGCSCHSPSGRRSTGSRMDRSR